MMSHFLHITILKWLSLYLFTKDRGYHIISVIFFLPLTEKFKSPIKIRLHKAYSRQLEDTRCQMIKQPREHTSGGPVNSVQWTLNYVYKTACVVWITAFLHDPLIENLDYWFKHLQANILNRLNIKVQNPVENNRAKSPSSLWKSVISSSISFVAWKRQRLDGTRDLFFSDFLIIVLQYEGPNSGSTALLKPEAEKKNIEKVATTRRNVCSTHTHKGYVQTKANL